MTTPDRFAEHMPAVAVALFGKPNPQHSKPGKPRWGRKGSLAIDETCGIWFDHENQEGGGVLDLIARERKLCAGDAVEWLNSIGCRVTDTGKPKVNGATHAAATTARKLIESYDYLDVDGSVVLQVRRVGFLDSENELRRSANGKLEKTFQQRRHDPENPKCWIWGVRAGEYMRKGQGQDWYPFGAGRFEQLPASRERQTFSAAKVIPYRAPELIEAIANCQTVFVVEGEQKADALAKWNLRATCNSQGAGKWTKHHAAYLKDADVVIVPDNDDTGRKHAEQVAQSLVDTAASIRILELPDLGAKGDFVDWQQAGHTREEFDALVKQAPEWQTPRTTERMAPVTLRSLIVQRAADVQIEPVEWLWPGRIALGKQTLLAGEAGLGKSQVSISAAAAVTTGGTWPCGEGRAPLGSVLFLCAEDGVADTIVPRLMAAGADLNRAHIVSAVHPEDGKGRRAFNLQADLDLLEQKIIEIGDVRLACIDPISSYMGAKVDSHVNAAVRGVLEPVGELANRLRVAILAITHPPKGTGTTAINRFIGSIAFVAAARAAFMVTRDSEDKSRCLFLPVKNNLAPLGNGLAFRLEQRLVEQADKSVVASAVVWDASPVNMSADDALRATDNGEDDQHSATDDAIEFLRTVLAAGPLRVADIEREAREARVIGENQAISQSMPFRSARKALKIETIKGGMNDGWTWQLPKMNEPPPDLRPIGVARSYSDLQRMIAEWCRRIGMTRAELDVEAGLADGHASKLLAPNPSRHFGFVTLGRVMAAAGLVLIVAAEPDANGHASEPTATSRPKHWRSNRGTAWGRRMAARRVLKQTPEQRSAVARQAAAARWQRHRQATQGS